MYEPGGVASSEGVLGKDLPNPVPERAEYRPDDGIVRYGVAPNMNTPDPDPGEEYPHINTQLFGVLDGANRGVLEDVTADGSGGGDGTEAFNEPREGQAPTIARRVPTQNGASLAVSSGTEGRLRDRLHQHVDDRARTPADHRGVTRRS